MQITKSNTEYFHITILIVVGVLLYLLSSGGVATAGVYADSAHGNESYGVNRSDTGHPIGDCANCHDTFDDSTCGVNERMLFNSQFTNQKSGLCMKCHQQAASKQEGGVLNNYDYSVVRGGEIKDCPASIRKQFWFIKYDTRLPRIYCSTPDASGSAHDLKNIRAYMKNKWGWGGTNAEVNPCCTCHNPHKATKDYPCSVPSSHSDTWQIWGDESGEKMADYVGGLIYEPPYKTGGGTERDAATLPDYNSLCLECHQYALPSFRHTDVLHNGYVRAIDWGISGDTHGKATTGVSWAVLGPPYEYINEGDYVLSCTDCHEPHGSRNEWLLRTEVNGKSGIEINGFYSLVFCTACHDDQIERYMGQGACTSIACHGHGIKF